MTLLLMSAIQPSVILGSPTRDGWGFGIADDGPPSRQILAGSGFRRLETNVFRFQVPYNAAYIQGELDRVNGKIAEAQAAGVQSIMVTFGQVAGENGPDFTRPSVAQWQTAVRLFVSMFDNDVDIWGVANEPNAGLGWLAGAHSNGPCLLAGYYWALHGELASRGWVDLLVSPEWHDQYAGNGELLRVGDLSPSNPDYHAGDSRTTVQHYIDHYTACEGGFGGAVGWHPYGDVKRRNVAGTLDLLAHTPSNLPVFFTEVGSIVRNNKACADHISLVEQEEQIRWLVEKLANEHPRIQRVYYYQQRPPGGCTWDSGLEDSGGNLRPSWWKYCSATHNGTCEACTGIDCDDANPCTDDSCSDGQCVNTFAPRCLAPVMSLLLDGACGDAILDSEEQCDDGNMLSGDCCGSDCRFEPAGTVCGMFCGLALHCTGSGLCQ